MNEHTERITINPIVCNGRQTSRNMQFSVNQLFELFAADKSEEKTLADL
jgi:uncharacterized protein (DUF433 family)